MGFLSPFFPSIHPSFLPLSLPPTLLPSLPPSFLFPLRGGSQFYLKMNRLGLSDTTALSLAKMLISSFKDPLVVLPDSDLRDPPQNPVLPSGLSFIITSSYITFVSCHPLAHTSRAPRVSRV